MHASTIAWYDSADKKAQVILTTNGAFLTFLVGSVFNPSAHWDRTFNRLGIITWSLLLAMCVCLVGAILSALKSLRSQLDNHSPDDFLAENGVRSGDAATYGPETMWFFQHIARLDRVQFRKRIAEMDRSFECRALSSNLPILCANVVRKHLWVNRGFLFTGVGLICFLLAGMSYIFIVSR